MSNIPIMDFRGSKFVNPDGSLTDVAQSFFDLLQQILVNNIGTEGLVAPSQTAVGITQIQNNTTSSVTGLISNTCQFGTLLYDSDNNLLKVALNNGSGNPIFKTITAT